MDKAILSLCAAHTCQMVLAEAVKDEVEHNLLKKALAVGVSRDIANQWLVDYDGLIRLAKPEMIAFPDKLLVLQSRHLIRHAADVPVLLSAMQAQPDWLLTRNTEHFNVAVAQTTGLRIGTPADFFRALVQSHQLP